MGEYGNGMTIGRQGELDKDRVRHALKGLLVAGEDENGFVYEPAPREECERYVLEVIDAWIYQAKQLADSGRVVERVMADHGWRIPFREYAAAMAEVSLDELHDEADRLLREDGGK